MPDVVRPGETVFLIVDGIAYKLVNDDGSDIGSSSDNQLFSGEVGDVPLSASKSDATVSIDRVTDLSTNISCVSVTSSGEFLKNGPAVLAVSPKEPELLNKNGPPVLVVLQKEPELHPDDSHITSLSSDSIVTKTSGVLSSDSTVISSDNFPQCSNVASEPTASQPRTVLADDDEFKHLTAEFANSLMPKNSRLSDPKAMTFTKTSVCVRRLPLLRPQLPKITLKTQPQARPQIQLITPATADSVSVPATVGPLTVTSSSTLVTSSPRQNTVTTVIRSSSSVNVANPQPSAFAAESPKKKKNASAEKDVTSAAAFKRSREPRITKRIVNMPVLSVLNL